MSYQMYGMNMPNYMNGYNGYNIPMQQPLQQSMQQPVPRQETIKLQGKSVDSIEVVKAMDIPLDGSISYFPIADGSAIVTKQLQMDGTSRTIVYKPVNESQQKNEINYISVEDFTKTIEKINKNIEDNSTEDLEEEIEEIKKQIESINKSIKDITKKSKN